MNLVKFIKKTILGNTDHNQSHGNNKFATEDLVYLRSIKDVENMSREERITYPTDYAIMNNALMSSSLYGDKQRKSCWKWLRSAYSSRHVK